VDGYYVLELNGAVDFTSDFGLGREPFAAAASELERVVLGHDDAPLEAQRIA
jgi:hypothetical protein